MPQGYVKKVAKEKGIPLEKAEEYWKKAEDAAKKQGHGEHYGYVTNIFKRMMHVTSEAQPFLSRATSLIATVLNIDNTEGNG